ncbi:MAG: hypothetical protein HQL37_01095 [Alphaproteobacteria bacterium]|nr:hypothetical protein [Alphaproteobacteria bacterium]
MRRCPPPPVVNVLLLMALVLANSAGRVWAAPGVGLGNQNDSTPTEIYADQGIEWVRDTQQIIAHVNARAVHGTTTVYADTLTAYYRPKDPTKAKDTKDNKATRSGKVKSPSVPAAGHNNAPATDPKTASNDAEDGAENPGGGNEIWRLVATGSVRIVTPDDTAYGDNADYDIDTTTLVLHGRPPQLVTPSEIITAKDSLEYNTQTHIAIGRGEAQAVSDDGRRLQADLLTAVITPAEKAPAEKAPAKKNPPGRSSGKPEKSGSGKEGGSEISDVYADGHVILTTPDEVALGNKGVYNVKTGIATLTGAVKITRGENQLNGEYGVVNLNTGISKVFPTAPGSTTRERVKLLLVPEKKDQSGQATSESEEE